MRYQSSTVIYLFYISLSFLIVSCSSRHLDDFREDSKDTVRALISELQQIRTRDDLNPHASQLEHLFNELAEFMVAARNYKQAHPNEELTETLQNNKNTELLRIEMNRILRLEGGKEVIEKAQESALSKLEKGINFQKGS